MFCLTGLLPVCYGFDFLFLWGSCVCFFVFLPFFLFSKVREKERRVEWIRMWKFLGGGREGEKIRIYYMKKFSSKNIGDLGKTNLFSININTIGNSVSEGFKTVSLDSFIFEVCLF